MNYSRSALSKNIQKAIAEAKNLLSLIRLTLSGMNGDQPVQDENARHSCKSENKVCQQNNKLVAYK